MGKLVHVGVPVTGSIDTAHPATNRPVGALVQAIDVGTKWLGPRLGGKSYTWAGRTPSVLGDEPQANESVEFDGTNSRVVGIMSREQADLGTKWTLDLAFQATAQVASAAAVPVFQWRTDNSITAINVGFYGTGHANANKLYAIVQTTSSAGVSAGTYTLVGAAPLFSSSLVSGGEVTRCFVRLIRNGSTLTLLSSRGSTAQSTSLGATDRHDGTLSQDGKWLFANDANLGANALFKGFILKALLRTTAVPTTYPLMANEHVFPRAPDVQFSARSKAVNSLHIYEASKYGAHGLQTSVTTGTCPGLFPLVPRVQGMGSYTDANGGTVSVVVANGVAVTTRNT